MTDPVPPPAAPPSAPDDDLLAAELVLGLPVGDEAAAARARLASDPAFRARADWWEDRLALDAWQAKEEPSSALWSRIEAALPANDPGDARTRAALARWRAAAIAASLAFVVVSGAWLLRPAAPGPAPTPTTTQPEPMLLATIAGEGTVRATVAYAPSTGMMRMAPGTLDTRSRVAELWVIPAGGQPRSLGMIDASHGSSHEVAADRRAMLVAGATLAISLEPPGGSPTGLPTGPVVGSGTIAAG